MTDQDLEDYDFDEYGIYRDKQGSSHGSGDQGINLDEDGIWRDDTDHGSHYTFKTYDSGIAINDRKYSHLRQQDSEYDRISFGQGSYTNDSLPADEKSLNISELEASESLAGDEISFENRSFHSDENLDLPELHDESYLLQSETSRDRGVDSGTENSDGDIGHRRPFRQHYAPSSDSDAHSRSKHSRDSIPDYRHDLNLDLELLNSDSHWAATDQENTVQENIPGPIRHVGPDIIGDSIFTQEDVLLPVGGHSLIEFEQLEARMHHAGDQGDNLDLIGAYLKGLEAQEEREGDSGDSYCDNFSPREDLSEDESHDQTVLDHHILDSWKRNSTNHNRFSHQFNQSHAFNMFKGNGNQIDQSRTERVSHGSPLAGSIHANDDDGLLESLLDNQRPPFDSLPLLSTLELSSGLRTGSSYGAGDRPGDRGYSPQPSKIPMLRSRSPAMSRPGSTNSNRGRPRSMSPGQRWLPDHHRGERGRSLPPTPGHRQNRPNSLSPHRSPSPVDERYSVHDDEGQDSVPQLHSLVPQRSDSRKSRQSSSSPGLKFIENSPRGGSASPSRLQPMKASHDIYDVRASSCDESEDLSQSSVVVTKDLKARFLKEKEDRKEKELTLQQLELEYNSLLMKHAEAENLIDQMRLGAKVSLYGDSPTPQQAQPGTMPAAQHAQSFSIPVAHSATLGSSGHKAQSQQATLQVMRPDSRASHASASTWNQGSVAPSNAAATGGEALAIPGDETGSIAEEGVKLSLLAKAKAVEEQVNAFQILLSEKELSIGDQERALHNIKSAMEELNQDYRDVKEEHEYMRRQGAIGGGSGRESVFDPSKEVEGELYKLGMKLDGMDHVVQENLKSKSKRVPFQGAMKADHSINVSKADSIASQSHRGFPNRRPSDDPEDLSPRRPPSVGSNVGAAGDIDEKLHRLNKDYNTLMDRYRRLKQMKKTPETDREIEQLLRNLKGIYEETPDHRKPALPPELESLYNPVQGSFLPPEQSRQSEEAERRARHLETPSRSAPGGERREGTGVDRGRTREGATRRDGRRRRTGESTSTVPSAIESSDISSPDRGGPHNRSRGRSTDMDYESSGSFSGRPDRRRQGIRELPNSKSGGLNTSLLSRQSRTDSRAQGGAGRSGSGSRNLPNKPPGRSGRRDGVGKDGGSESSRKKGKDSSSVTTPSRERSRQQPVRTSALKSPNQYSDTDSASTASTVEERRTRKPPSRSSDGSRKAASSDGSRKATSKGSRQSGDRSMDSGDSYGAGRHSESEEVSMISGNRRRHQIENQANDGSNPGHNATQGVAGSAFVPAQSHPHIIQPRPLQAGQLPQGVLPNGVTTSIQPPQYQVLQAPTVAGASQPNSGVAMVATHPNPGVPMVTSVNPGMMAGAPMMGMNPVHVGNPQPQIMGAWRRQVMQRPMGFGSQPGPRPQILRPQDQFVNMDSYGRARSRSFGGGAGEDPRGGLSPMRSRYRSTQALSGRHNPEYRTRDRFEMRGKDRYHSGYDSVEGTDREREPSPYDYRKRFEQIREQRYGIGRKDDKAVRDTGRFQGGSPKYGQALSDDYRNRRKDGYRDRTKHRRDGYGRTYNDFADHGGYYSDPESPRRSPERYPRTRDNYRSRDTDYYDDYRSNTEDYFNDYYDGSYAYMNEYDNAPLDEKYLTGAGVGLGAGMDNGMYADYGAHNAGIYNGVMPDGTSMHGQNIGVQNVPQMTSMGVQYMPPQGANPNLGTHSAYNMSVGGVPGTAIGAGVSAAGTPTPCPYCGGYSLHAHGNYVHNPTPVPQQVTVATNQGTQPVVVMPAQVQGHGYTAAASTSGNYLPVHMIGGGTSSGVGLANHMQGAVPLLVSSTNQTTGIPAVVVGGASGVGGANASLNSSKVRYYVREYGAESEVESGGNRVKARSSQKSSRVYQEVNSDTEDVDLNDSLREAMKTAKRLHKMSNKMKNSLHVELNKSYKGKTYSK